MEIIFIAAFLVIMIYLGLWKFVVAAFSVLLVAYLISEAYAKKRAAKDLH